MTHRRHLLLALVVLLATPLLSCNPNVVTAWGDLVETAKAIWAGIWSTPEPDYYGISVLCSDDLLAAHGNPPGLYVDAIAATTEEIADAWGVAQPYSCLLYTSDAADDLLCVDLGGRRILKKKKKQITYLYLGHTY